MKSVSSDAKVGDGDVGGEMREHVSGVHEGVSNARFALRDMRLGRTEHTESERFRCCACRACASYV